MKTYSLPLANAKAAASVLNEIYASTGSVRVIAISDTEIVVYGPATDHYDIAKHVQVGADPAPGETVVIPMGEADASRIADWLIESFGSGGPERPYIRADTLKNAIVVMATPSDLNAIKARIDALTGNGIGKSIGGRLLNEHLHLGKLRFADPFDTPFGFRTGQFTAFGTNFEKGLPTGGVAGLSLVPIQHLDPSLLQYALDAIQGKTPPQLDQGGIGGAGKGGGIGGAGMGGAGGGIGGKGMGGAAGGIGGTGMGGGEAGGGMGGAAGGGIGVNKGPRLPVLAISIAGDWRGDPRPTTDN